jgi:hypothetical protein
VLGRIFGCERNILEFRGENSDWVKELSVGENIWMLVGQLKVQR